MERGREERERERGRYIQTERQNGRTRRKETVESFSKQIKLS